MGYHNQIPFIVIKINLIAFQGLIHNNHKHNLNKSLLSDKQHKPITQLTSTPISFRLSARQGYITFKSDNSKHLPSELGSSVSRLFEQSSLNK